MYVGLKVFHDVCIILYTCKSSLYFILVLFFGGSSSRASWKISFFSFLLNVLPSENKDYYYYYYYYFNTGRDKKSPADSLCKSFGPRSGPTESHKQHEKLPSMQELIKLKIKIKTVLSEKTDDHLPCLILLPFT